MAQLKLKQADVKAQTDKVARMKLQVGQVALAQFQNRSLDTAAHLFVTPDTDRFLSQISTVQKVSENQNSALQDFQQAQANLAALEHSAETDLAALAEKEKQLKSLTAASDKKIAQAKKVLAKLTVISAEADLRMRRRRRPRGPTLRGAPRRRETPLAAPSRGSGRGAKALAYAKAQLGEPYVRNGDGPSSWDCSGLTMRAWGSVGVSLPHSSGQQYNRGRSVAKSDLQLGDLVFFYSDIATWASTPATGRSSTPHGPASLWSTSRCPTCRTPEPVGPAEVRRIRCACVTRLGQCRALRLPVAALTLLLVGCSAPAVAPSPAPPATRVMASESSRLGQVRATVDALVQAARTRDRTGFERLISDRDPTFPDRARLLYDNLSTLPLTRLQIRVEPAQFDAGRGTYRATG